MDVKAARPGGVGCHYSVINSAATVQMIQAVQADDHSNVISAPKVCTFNGQTAMIMCGVQRPFVVGWRKRDDGGHQPQVRVISDGTEMRLRAMLSDAQVRLDCQLRATSVNHVETLQVPQPGAKPPVSVQIPDVNQVAIDASVDVPLGQTLALATRNPKNGKELLLVLLTVEQVQREQAPRDLLLPAANQTRARREFADEDQAAADLEPVRQQVAAPEAPANEVSRTTAAPSAEASSAGANVICVCVYKVEDLVPKGKGAPNAPPNYQPLIQSIMSQIAPASWEDAGGDGVIREYANTASLVVRQTNEVHQRIAEYLEGLRKKNDGSSDATAPRR